MTAKDMGKEIIICLENELMLYNKIAFICFKLKDAISSETDFRLVEDIISEKIRVREEVEKLSIIRSELHCLSENSTEIIVQFKSKIKRVINKIIEYEKECESKMTILHKDIGERLLQVNKGFQMTKAFSKGFTSPTYLSIKL
ncbi:MAG: hypothetical protein HZA08_00420 [Nitrospirae bacterium]|nr:hypothetical protein [Nitrospirota bacterium]